MTTRDDSYRQPNSLLSQTGSRWRQILFLGIIGLGLLVFLGSRDRVRPPTTDQAGNEAQRGSAAALPSGGGAWTTPSTSPASLDAASGERAAAASSLVQGRNAAIGALVLPAGKAQVLNLEGATDLQRLLQEMRERGPAAVPAIRDFLRTQQDMILEATRSGKPAEQGTLRLAMIDMLRQIGGPEAIETSLEQIRMTETPKEIAMLAINLETAAPGVYREEAMWTVVNALQASARTKDPLEVRPLFEALQVLGGTEAMSVLEQLPHNADMVGYLRNKDTNVSPTVGTYALITLAGLPDGGGISTLADLAGDPNVPVSHRTVAPFQMLAQASSDQALAGEELVELALAKQIPDRAWDAVANALAGKHLQFPSSPAYASGASAPFVRGFYDDERNVLYEERLVSRNWSAAQTQQQLILIDTLLDVTNAPAATQALQRARQTLQRRRP